MKRNPWPYAIIIYFLVFIGGLAAWITFAVRNDHELVRKDYYEQELKFQNELDDVARAVASGVNISHNSVKQILTVSLPLDNPTGRLKFYRSSNARLDQEISLALKDGVQSIDVRSFESGLWKIRLTWTANGAEYQHDQTLIFTTTKLTAL